MSQYQLNILHLFPDLLNLYGDKGNLAALEKRLLWRGIDVTVQTHAGREASLALTDTDILFLGGGSDREQELVLEILRKQRASLKS